MTQHGIALLQSAEYQAKLDQCIHCGLCLPACPTYAVNGREAQSPRGRIVLMRSAAAGAVALADPVLHEHLDSCLACRACEPACPSGVQYGALIEGVRVAMHGDVPGKPAARFAAWLGLRQLMPHVGRLRLIAAATKLYQRSGAQTLVRRIGLPGRLAFIEALAPPIGRLRPITGRRFPAQGQPKGRVALHQGCVQEAFLSAVNDATIRVLQRNGYEVVVPFGQTCCGAAQLHVGDEKAARDLARRNIDALLAVGADAIISNAGGCGLALKDYPALLRDDKDYQARVALFAAQVRDVCEFLGEHAIDAPRASLPLRATYVDSCHLRHGQRVIQQPRQLLRSIPGLTLVELAQPDRCCGSAGTYNLTHPALADAILDAKLADVVATRCEVVVVSNTGCHLQLIAGVQQAGLPARVLHLVQLLDEAYAREGEAR